MSPNVLFLVIRILSDLDDLFLFILLFRISLDLLVLG